MLKYSFQAFLVLYSIRGVGASRCEAAAGRFCVVNRKGFMLCCCPSSVPPPFFYITFYGFTCQYDFCQQSYKLTWCELCTSNMSVLINCKKQFVLHSLHLIISIVLYAFHFILYSMLEESRGSNGNRFHEWRPEPIF